MKTNENKHTSTNSLTSRKWSIKAVSFYKGHVGHKTLVVDEKDNLIADTDSRSFSSEESEVHAALIAAAPDMKAALEDIASPLPMSGDWTNIQRELNARMLRAKQAIAKAEQNTNKAS